MEEIHSRNFTGIRKELLTADRLKLKKKSRPSKAEVNAVR
jgi:hypothetical protein